jgi:hypothetical protein
LIERKLCPKCQRDLPLSRFRKNAGKPQGVEHTCKTCDNARRKANAKQKKRAESSRPVARNAWQDSFDERLSGVYSGTVVSKSYIDLSHLKQDADEPYYTDQAYLEKWGYRNPIIMLNRADGDDFSGRAWKRLRVGCYADPVLLALYDEAQIGSRVEITVTGEGENATLTYVIN